MNDMYGTLFVNRRMLYFDIHKSVKEPEDQRQYTAHDEDEFIWEPIFVTNPCGVTRRLHNL